VTTTTALPAVPHRTEARAEVTPAAAEAAPVQRLRTVRSLVPGLAAVAAVALVATIAGRWVPIVGAPVFGVVMGALLSTTLGRAAWIRTGRTFASGRVLQFAVVVLGAQLSLTQVVNVGVGSLPVMLGTLGVCLTLAFFLGRRLGVGGDLRTLIGVGTGICGASAIAAVSPTIRAKHPDIAYAISTIFLFNILAVLTFPPLGHALHLSQHAFGLFAGTAVNDTSSVVAAAGAFGAHASQYAVVVKLTRTLMIIPICLGLAALVRRRDRAQGADGADGAVGTAVELPAWRRAVRLVPWFLTAFVIAAAANSAHLIPAASHAALQQTALALITVALTAIGMSTDLAGLRRAGARPLVLGLALWAAVTVTSLVLQLI
jgi:uncharacterized integral membrane protein (TIGR00698 family)